MERIGRETHLFQFRKVELADSMNTILEKVADVMLKKEEDLEANSVSSGRSIYERECAGTG